LQPVSTQEYADASSIKLEEVKIHLEGGEMNRWCMSNLMINDAKLKTNCNTLSVIKKGSRIPGEGF